MPLPDPFAFAAPLILGLEGPQSDNPTTDPDGGLTRYGISQTQHPEVDVAGLTYDTALAWYRANEWQAGLCDRLPWPLNVLYFDCRVNQGEGEAPRLLQAALGVAVDGDIGPVTLAAAGRADPWEACALLAGVRAVGYAADKEWAANGKGWIARVARVLVAVARAG